MGKAKDIALKPQVNRFAVLADSDDEYPNYAPMTPKKEVEASEVEASEVEAAFTEAQPELQTEPEPEPEPELKVKPVEAKEGEFRVWKTEEKRFDTTNIFSSPFSHKKKKEWVSIQEFPSLLTRGDEEAAAHAWAEKVKSTLEKAGQQRKSLSFFRRLVDDKF